MSAVETSAPWIASCGCDSRSAGRNLRRTGTRFELTTLLALQDALQQLAHLCGTSMHFDHMQARKGEHTRIPHELSEEKYANLVEVRRLTSRVVDSGIRDAVEKFIEISARLSTVPKALKGLSGERLEDRALARYVELTDGYLAVSSVVGEAVRGAIAWQPPGRPAL